MGFPLDNPGVSVVLNWLVVDSLDHGVKPHTHKKLLCLWNHGDNKLCTDAYLNTNLGIRQHRAIHRQPRVSVLQSFLSARGGGPQTLGERRERRKYSSVELQNIKEGRRSGVSTHNSSDPGIAGLDILNAGVHGHLHQHIVTHHQKRSSIWK